MKVRVSIPGACMVMELEDRKALWLFRKMTELMLAAGARQQAKEEPEPDPEPVPVDPEPAEHDLELEEDIPEVCAAEDAAEESAPEEPTEELPVMPEKIAPPKALKQYSGFLHIKCPDCGYSRSFFTKIRTSEFRCECGAVTELRDLVPLYINCECGRNIRYQTNMTDNVFDIDCLGCGAPVAVQWNKKKKLYETIR